MWYMYISVKICWIQTDLNFTSLHFGTQCTSKIKKQNCL